MNVNEALALVEAALHENRLSKLQKAVFCQTWEDQSYGEIARRCGYELGYIKQTGSQLWQMLSEAFNEKVTKHNVQTVLTRKAAGFLDSKQTAMAFGYAVPKGIASRLGHPSSPLSTPPSFIPWNAANLGSEVSRAISCSEIPTAPPLPPRTDWGDAVDLPTFYGRTQELQLLQRWILRDRCRLVGIFGMGGIGKTTLSVKLARQLVQSETSAPFEYVIWRSLRNAPPLEDLLADLLQFISDQNNIELPESLDGRIRRFIEYLRRYRCLIVLDNGETVMQQGDHGGGYLPGYEGYGQLWRSVGEADHQSSVVLTSREKPGSFAVSEGEGLPIRSLRLPGLPTSVGQEIFQLKGEFSGTEAEWQTLIDHYAGNPLALKMVASVIQDLFDGQIASFLECLQEGTSVFGDIQDLLAQQLNRLSDLEQQMMGWLAIARKPITLSQLRANFVPSVPLGTLLEALASLERRCLIDKTTPRLTEKAQTRFTLQPAVMEYVTERIIQQVCHEIHQVQTHPSSPPPTSVLQTHSLLQAQAKDYIRETQIRLLLKPVVERLLGCYSLEELEQRFRMMLNDLRQLPLARQPRTYPTQMGYAGGNILNLLCQMGTDLSGWDFSGLTVWNAYLRRVNLHQVNFTGADLSGSVFTETFSQVLAIAFSPDGKLLATGDVNHEIHIWQVADGKQLLSCRVDEGWVWSLAFSPDGRTLASTANRSVKLWDVQTGACIRTFQGYSDRVFSVAFSADGQLLATGSEDHLIRVWHLRTGQLLHTLMGHTDEVRSVAFSPSELRFPGSKSPALTPLLASASYDGTLRLWDLNSGDCIHQLEGHTQRVWSVAFSPDGHTLASGGDDATVKLWEVSTGRCLQTLWGHTHQIRSVAFDSDGRTLASGSDDRTVRLWDYQTGECLRVLTGHTSWIAAVAFSPDSGLLASGSEDQSVRLWDSRTSLCLKTLQGYSNGVWSVAFDPRSEILASGSQDRTIRLWNCQTGKLLNSLHGHSSWVWSVAFSPTQPLLASGSEDQTIKLWDTHTHQLLQTLEGHRDAALSVLFSQDGSTLFSGSLDGTLKFWDTQTGTCYRTLLGHNGGIWCLAVSADGQLLASGSQDQTLKIWRVQTGECLQTLAGHTSWIRSIALSGDRQTLISGSADGTIKLWHAATGTCLRTLSAHRGPVLSLAFHPSGSRFASCSTDTTVKQWDVNSGNCLQTLTEHKRWVRFLAYSPAGEQLASCGQDETIRLWQTPNPEATPELHCTQTLRIPRPYEGMAIAHIKGLTDAQKATLKMLGAIDQN